MVPRRHKQALWKDWGRLFNHGIPEESQWDTHFVPLLLAHKFNCFTRTTRNLIQRPTTSRGSRWIYVCVCLWSVAARVQSVCVPVCVCVFVLLQMNSHHCYIVVSVYLQTQSTKQYTLESMSAQSSVSVESTVLLHSSNSILLAVSLNA